MLNSSKYTLKILSGIVWYLGGIILILKGSRLLFSANTLMPNQIWPWIAIIFALFFGSLKANFFFSKTCKNNLIRISKLQKPKIWQFFRLRFFLFLLIMILLGMSLSRFANHNYPFLIAVAALDLSIAIALIESSYIFWIHEPFKINVTQNKKNITI